MTRLVKIASVGGAALFFPRSKAKLLVQRTQDVLGSRKMRYAGCPGSPSKVHCSEAMTGSAEQTKISSKESLDPCLNGSSGYKKPSQEIVDIIDVPSMPALSLSPNRKLILQSARPSSMPPITELAVEELKLAGLRLISGCFSRSRMSYFTGLALVDATEVVPAPEDVQRQISGIPEGMWINSVSFSEEGKRIAFTIRSSGGPNDPIRGPSELWIADVDTCVARPLAMESHLLNTIFQDYTWVDENTIAILQVPHDIGTLPSESSIPSGPSIQDSSAGTQAQNPTYQDLLKNEHDEEVFEYMTTSELVILHVDTGEQIAKAQPRMYTSVSPSPDGQFLLVSWMERPFSYQVPCGRFPKRIEVWDRNLNCIHKFAYLPLAEDIPLAFDSCRKGPRSVRWRPDKNSEICWIETQDGGDSRLEASPRDLVYTQEIESAPNMSEPAVLSKTDLRCRGVTFCDGDLALVYEGWRKSRRSIVSAIAPDNRSEDPDVLFDRNYEDVYNDPGQPMMRQTSRGTYILAKIDGKRKLLLQGRGASAVGNKPFLDVFDLDTKEKKRIWESIPPFYEDVATILNDEDDRVITLEGLQLLTTRESTEEVPQYVVKEFSGDGTIMQERFLTKFPHPYPQMKDLQKEIIRYKRSDGVDLTATLYLPVGYVKERDGTLPCLMWVYPREYKSKDAAGQLRRSPYEFVNIGATSPIVMLAKNYAVLDGPTLPIVAEDGDEPNDTYIEQLEAAAIQAVVERGVADRKRIAIGGHSYGAFAAANLLANCPGLFACGIARSGAYNRTLTPFSFQAEDRTLWEAPEVYLKMSPFMKANKITVPFLLIHGVEDTNPGTYPMQSERFFEALKGHGVQARLVLLPHETHSYRAYESILHTMHEVERWLEMYCNK